MNEVASSHRRVDSAFNEFVNNTMVFNNKLSWKFILHFAELVFFNHV